MADESIENASGEQKPEEEFAFPAPENENGNPDRDLEFILDIPLSLTVELGRTRMPIADLLKLGEGAVVELDRPSGGPVDILANDRLIARGDVVVVKEKYGVRITEIVTPAERIERLG
ncbi:MAG: flagellar motor switch protein FliN [Desulfococcaceae bacterium]